MAIQLAREIVVSLKVRLSHSLVAPVSSSIIFRLLGLHVAQASTPPESIAVTMAEASISTAVMSFMVMLYFASEFFRISSLEVPEE